MSRLPDKEAVLSAIRKAVADVGGRRVSRVEFVRRSGMKVADIDRYFDNWTQALSAAGSDFEPYHQKIKEDDLLKDWGELARKLQGIPTRKQYKRMGKYSAGVIENRFGPWSATPSRFLQFARDKPEWADVLALLPQTPARLRVERNDRVQEESARHSEVLPGPRHTKLGGRPIYGNPIDFRGLRHEPVNEQGVVFLFGMVARELGYLVEGVQSGFPDCEAKRQVGPNRWQPVRVEFEFESREFRDHGHPVDGCDVIVCWRHNWPGCPLEVVELSTVIRSLAKSED